MSVPTVEYFTAWKIKEHLTMPDPEETRTRYHTYLFIRKDTSTSSPLADKENTTAPPMSDDDNIAGWTHEVTGDISTATGMNYLHKPVACSPEHSDVFYAKQFLGYVRANGYPGNVDVVCQSIPPPGCQKKFNTETMRYEGVVFEDVDGDEGRRTWRFYEPGEERKAYFKCTEWLEERVLPKLVADGVIVFQGGTAERSGVE